VNGSRPSDKSPAASSSCISWNPVNPVEKSNFGEALPTRNDYLQITFIKERINKMIRKMSHATIFVNNQNEALEFYRDKLGFKVHTDAMVGEDFRWLTMCTNDQPDFEIILMEPKPGMLMDEETCGQLRAIMNKGVLGAGVFNTDDCRGTYEELKAKGVQFISEPAERPYGVEAVFKDNSGNWFSLTQPSEGN
jgi:catechol 2,3-dioxygenase-like lactoylglutathione lyase family enzyme